MPVQALTYAIERSCINKAQVVEADEREGGLRATLNLGHTFGHAIEAAQGYGTLTPSLTCGSRLSRIAMSGPSGLWSKRKLKLLKLLRSPLNPKPYIRAPFLASW